MQAIRVQTAGGVGVGVAVDVREKQNAATVLRDSLVVLIQTSAGTSVSVQIEVSPNNSNWFASGAAFTTVNGSTVVEVPRSPFVRVNVTAAVSVTVDAWVVV